jgi:hypothetical protein
MLSKISNVDIRVAVGRGMQVLFQKSVMVLFGVGMLGSLTVNASAQNEQISRQNSTLPLEGRWQISSDGCKVWNPAPVPNESVTWSGGCANGFGHGDGTEAWFENGKIGNVITGTMANGRFSGVVTVRYPNGSVYKGKLSSSGRGGPDGDGLFTSASGRVFQVSYSNGKRTRFVPDKPSQDELTCSSAGLTYGSREFRQCLLRLEQISKQTEKPIYITSDDSGSDYYYDTNSVRVSNGQVVVWVTRDAKKDKTVKFRNSKQRIMFDCDSENNKFLQYISYSSTGRVLESYSYSQYEQEWEGVVPGSIGAAVLTAVCSIR